MSSRPAHARAYKPESGKPESGKPESGKPESGKPESGKPESGKPEAEDLGRLFLKTEGIKRFVVASPGDISVECELNDQPPPSKTNTKE
jgi:hypothetical protein